MVVFVEPGTPDGFGLLRSVRTAMLECCPPSEVRERRRREREARAAYAAETAENVVGEDGEEATSSEEESYDDGEDEDDESWHEECRVLAPCTHDGTCPMSRHRVNHVKRNARFGKYDAAAEPQKAGSAEATDEGDGESEQGEEEKKGGGYMSEWEGMHEDEREELKVMLGAEGASDEDMEEMLMMADEEDSDEEDDDEREESDDDDDDADNEDRLDDDCNNIDNAKGPLPSDKSCVREGSFCSFVHNSYCVK